jgi:hypothetical protein
MGKWDTIGDADAAGDKKPWCEVGRYWVKIIRCLDRQGRTGINWYIIEFEIQQVESTADPKKMVAGKIYSQAINFNEDMGPINVKRFILAAEGKDPNDADNNDEVDGATVEYTLSEEQPLAGVEMWLQCDLIKTRKGADYTKHTWFPAESDE